MHGAGILGLIDQRACVDPGAEIDDDVTIGPFAVIGPQVRIGKGTWVGPHTVIKGPTSIGEHNRIYQFASVGEDPQDKKYAGEATRLEIGDRNIVREFATIHRGTAQDAALTRIGNDNLLMAYSHVAHDCFIANNTIMANAASLGGHVHIEDWAILGGFSIVHQFCHIGAHSFSAMGSVLKKDLLPYVTVSGHPARPFGINSEGLKRRGFSPPSIQHIKQAYKLLYKSHLKLDEALQAVNALAQEYPEVACMAAFAANSERSIIR